MLEKLAKSIEEVNVLAEHYRTCQNVAAIESLAKECFISKEDTDAFIAGKSCCLLKVPLMGQSGSVTEKLTEEMLLLQDSGYATVLGTYLFLPVLFSPCLYGRPTGNSLLPRQIPL